MFRFGIRQPGNRQVTGTTVMMDADSSSNETKNSGGASIESGGSTRMLGLEVQIPNAETLKKDKLGIILYPQPMDDPNDPLNWPVLRKDLCFLIIGFQTFIGGGQTPILAAGFQQLLAEFHKPTAVISYLVGAFMLSLGIGSVFASPTAILYGKRLVYILSIGVFLVGAIICAASKNYGGLMAGRILTGFGASPTESLASASLSELYFQHERAYRTGLYTLLLLGGKNILPLLSSLVFQHLNRHWLYWIELMFLALNLVLTFLFVPETYWDRSLVSTEKAKTDPQILPKSFRNRLHVVSGRHSADKWWMVALRPMYLYAYPGVFYGALVYSLAVVWLIVISEVLSEIFRAPPYGYSAQTIGLFYISPFVGGILGSLSAGIFGDMVTRMVVRANHGIYEPEFRLLMLIPSTIFTCIGLMGYGWSAHVLDPWIAPVVFFGCLSFGSSMASTTAITYTIDCYKMFAAEALVSFNFAKNVIGFVFSLFNNHAYLSLDGRRLFVIYGCVQLLVGLLGILFYVYGKVLRAWTDDKEMLRGLYRADKFISASET